MVLHTLLRLGVIYVVVACFGAIPDDSFYLHHYGEKCAVADVTGNFLIFKSVCSDKFRWSEGARLIHVATKKCLVPAAVTDSSVVQLTGSCSGTDTLFQQLASPGSIKHLVSGKCIQPESFGAKAKMVILSDCSAATTGFWLVREVMYVIKHFSGLCWNYIASENLIRMINTYVCDRFTQVNNNKLQHVATGKCVVFSTYFRLAECASSTALSFDLDADNILHETTTNLCVHVHLGALAPVSGTGVVLHNCGNEDRLRFYFYDERSKLFFITHQF